MGISTKKILTIILSVGLLFVISCGDRPTGSTTDGGTPGSLPSEYNGNNYASDETEPNNDFYHFWLIIKDGNIYLAIGDNKDTPPANFESDGETQKFGPTFKVSGNAYTSEDGSYRFNFNSATTLKMDMLDPGSGEVGASVSFTKK